VELKVPNIFFDPAFNNPFFFIKIRDKKQKHAVLCGSSNNAIFFFLILLLNT